MEKHIPRVTLKLKQPNPLFEKWITEWHDKEVQKDSKQQRCFKIALDSLKRYPLPFKTGMECIILKGFGKKLCKMLDEKLRQHTRVNKAVQPVEINANSEKNIENVNTENNLVTKQTKVSRTNKTKKVPSSTNYSPAYRSGGYAIIIALYEETIKPDYKGFQLKKDIIKNGQKYCDKSFVKSDPGNYYTAWGSMSTVISKGFVVKEGNPARFALTELGCTLGKELCENKKRDEDNENKNNDGPKNIDFIKNSALVKSIEPKNNIGSMNKEIVPKKQFKTHSSSSSITSDSTTCEESFTLMPNSFDIYLLIDVQETTRSFKKDDPITGLDALNIKYEIRHLKIGDYAWVCRDRLSQKELVLPYILERKRMDDFGSSIKDGRFHEQKFRLKQSGIENLIYLVESYGKNVHTGLPLGTLYQAATNTLIQEGFCVKFTDGPKATMEYLNCITTIIIQLFKSKYLSSISKAELPPIILADDKISLMTFKEFNKSSSKTKSFKVRDLFIKQLLQLKGISVDKAIAITEIYETPNLLKQKYTVCTTKEAENLLSGIQFGKAKKSIGVAISKTIYQLYNSSNY